MNPPKRQLGFALPIAILIVAILIVVGGAGYYSYTSYTAYREIKKPEIVKSEEKIQKEPVSYPIKTWNFIASNDPNDYLGDYIGNESPSDWKVYPPLVNKVNELTVGLTSNRDKALAIANWVKQSKRYKAGPQITPREETSIANQGGTIIEIFEAEEGVCLDAAYLTTAMFRLARVPARAVAPSRGVLHEYTEAYLDNNWYPIDTTFGSGQARFPAVLDPNPPLRYIHDYSGWYDNDNTHVFLVKTVTKEDYGTVQYPTVSEKELDEWYKEWPKQEGVYITELKFYCQLYVKENGKWVGLWSPGFHEKEEGICAPPPPGEELKPCRPGSYGRRFLDENYRDKSNKFEDVGGWIHAALPPGNYKFECSIRNLFDQKPPYEKPPYRTAYAEFLINSNTKTTVTPEMFRKTEDADQKEFEALVNLMQLD